jgi:sucrose-6-phosphate hydrolase SacC (GH32 family)
MRICVYLSLLVALTCQLALAADSRDRLLEESQAYWKLGIDNSTAAHPLKAVGNIQLGLEAAGENATPGAKVAKLSGAYFDAGKELNLHGNQGTVYLRARDPSGQWSHALFAKRGHHEIINFNLFGSGDLLGMELHGDGGIGHVAFPRSAIQSTGWHDLIGRYDGEKIELICDGRIVASQPWAGGALTQNDEPLLIGAETERGQVVRPFSGEMEEAAIWSRALSYREIASIVRKPKIDGAVEPERLSALHFRPQAGGCGDVTAFYWKGAYHVFYLQDPYWHHRVSTDLVRWKDMPPALKKGDDPTGPDGEGCWSGSIIEHDGIFYLFYTGKGSRDPKGDQKVMVATCTDSDLSQWIKHPEWTFYADGKYYWNTTINGSAASLGPHHGQSFRDPDVFWNAAKKQWWMLLHTVAVEGVMPCIGLYTSTDLVHWTVQPPLVKYPLAQESIDCPHAAPIGNHWFIICADANYTTAKGPEGPYPPKTTRYDYGDLLVPKSLFDGRRRLIWGWIRDLKEQQDAGAAVWGGTISLPREIYSSSTGEIFERPVEEIVQAFSHSALDLSSRPKFTTVREDWRYKGSQLTGRGECYFDVPDDYLVQCQVQLEPNTDFTLVMRRQAEQDKGYKLVVSPKNNTVSLARGTSNFVRTVKIDITKPVEIQAFVQGAIIECFVNKRWAFTCRAYDFGSGGLGLKVDGGQATVQQMSVHTLADGYGHTR